MSVTPSKLFNDIFIDLTTQLGWDAEKGVTNPESLQVDSVEDCLVVKSRVSDIRVIVVEEDRDQNDTGIRVLTLSDTHFSITALVWNYTEGVNADAPLLSRVIELQDFDVSVRHAPLSGPVANDAEQRKQQKQQELLQFSLVINRLQVLETFPVLPARLGVEVRSKANVIAFLDQFKALRASSGITNTGDPTIMGSNIATQLPIESQPLTEGTETQETRAASSVAVSSSHEGLQKTSSDNPAEFAGRSLTQQASHRAEGTNWRQVALYDADEDWLETTTSNASARTYKHPQAQKRIIRWAPPPGTRNVEPSLPEQDLALMVEYADRADDYIDLVQADQEPLASTAQHDVSDEEHEADIVSAAEKLRHNQNSPEEEEDDDDDEMVGPSQWPASDPPEPTVTQTGTMGYSSDDEAEQSHHSLPPDSDPRDTDVELNPNMPVNVVELDEDNDSDNSLVEKGSIRRKTTQQGLPMYELDSDLDDIAGSSSEDLTENEHKLAGLLKAARDKSPRKARIHRKLKAAGAHQHSSPSSQLHHTQRPHTIQQHKGISSASVQVHRTPYTFDKRTGSASSPRQTSPSPASKIMPPPSSSVRLSFSSRQTISSSASHPVASSAPQSVTVRRQDQQPSSSSRDFSSSVEGIAKPITPNIEELEKPQSKQRTADEPSQPPPSSPQGSMKRKLDEPQARAPEQKKKAKLYVIRRDSFELSQDLLDHAGPEYAVDDLRATHFGWRGIERQADAGSDTAIDGTGDEPIQEAQEAEEDALGEMEMRDEEMREKEEDEEEDDDDDDDMQDGQGQPDDVQLDHAEESASLETESGRQHTKSGSASHPRSPQPPSIRSHESRQFNQSRSQTPQTSARPQHRREVYGSATASDTKVQLFETFKQAYPSWTGRLKDFLDICHKIPNCKVQRNFYDDFVIRYREEYCPYAVEYLYDNQQPMTYEDWFEETLYTPRYTLKIINRDTLQQVLAAPKLHSAELFMTPPAPGSFRTSQSASDRDSPIRTSSEHIRTRAPQREISRVPPAPASAPRPSASASKSAAPPTAQRTVPDVPQPSSRSSRKSLPWNTKPNTTSNAPPSSSTRRNFSATSNGKSKTTAIDVDEDVDMDASDDEIAITGYASRPQKVPSSAQSKQSKPPSSRTGSATIVQTVSTTPREKGRDEARGQAPTSTSVSGTGSTSISKGISSSKKPKRQVIIPPDKQKARSMTGVSREDQQPLEIPEDFFRSLRKSM